MATSAELIAAARDQDLTARVAALAAAEGIPAPQQWAESHAAQLVATPIPNGGGTTTLAAVLAYTQTRYVPTPRPGEDPTGVLDAQIQAAITALRAE